MNPLTIVVYGYEVWLDQNDSDYVTYIEKYSEHKV